MPSTKQKQVEQPTEAQLVAAKYLQGLAVLDGKLRQNFQALSKIMAHGGAPGCLLLAHAQVSHAANQKLAFLFKKAGLPTPQWIPLYKAKSGEINIEPGVSVSLSEVSQLLSSIPNIKAPKEGQVALNIGGATLGGEDLRKLIDAASKEQLNFSDLAMQIHAADLTAQALAQASQVFNVCVNAGKDRATCLREVAKQISVQAKPKTLKGEDDEKPPSKVGSLAIGVLLGSAMLFFFLRGMAKSMQTAMGPARVMTDEEIRSISGYEDEEEMVD